MRTPTMVLWTALLLAPASIALAQPSPAETHDSHAVDSADGEHAEQGAEHAEHVEIGDVFKSIEFWGAVVNFLLLIGVIYYLARKPLSQYLKNRRQAVVEGLTEAASMKSEAEAKHAEYSRRLEQLDLEMEQIRSEMVKAGEAERDRIVAEAESKAQRMRKDTEFLIEQQMKQLRVDLMAEAVDAAVSSAETALRDATNIMDQENLGGVYLQELEERAHRKETT